MMKKRKSPQNELFRKIKKKKAAPKKSAKKENPLVSGKDIKIVKNERNHHLEKEREGVKEEEDDEERNATTTHYGQHEEIMENKNLLNRKDAIQNNNSHDKCRADVNNMNRSNDGDNNNDNNNVVVVSQTEKMKFDKKDNINGENQYNRVLSLVKKDVVEEEKTFGESKNDVSKIVHELTHLSSSTSLSLFSTFPPSTSVEESHEKMYVDNVDCTTTTIASTGNTITLPFINEDTTTTTTTTTITIKEKNIINDGEKKNKNDIFFNNNNNNNNHNIFFRL